MVDLGATIADSGSVISDSFQFASVTSFQGGHRRCFHNHRRDGVGKAYCSINPQSVLFVISAYYSHFDLRVACWIDPCNSVTVVFFQQ